MTLLGELLFPPADYRRTTLSTLTWWESRRGVYNLVVGGTGGFALVVIRLIAWMPPGMHFDFNWRPVVAFGLMANLCYTFGFGIELMLKRVMGNRAPAIGPALFRQGLAFSVGLTLLPILMASVAWAAHLAMVVFG